MNTPAQKSTAKKKPLKRTFPKHTENVEVFCRIRPLENLQEIACIRKLSSSTVSMVSPESLRNGTVNKETTCTFQKVFDESTSQEILFEQIALPLVDDVLHGKNGLLFAYGVTSSGKTHTMNGTPQDRGVLPRCLECIFNSIVTVQAKKYVFKPDKMNGFDVQSEVDAMLERQARDITPRLVGLKNNNNREPNRSSSAPDISCTNTAGANADHLAKVTDVDTDCFYSVFVSYVEIYNNYVYDLLEDLPYDPMMGYKPPISKNIREDVEHNMYVSGVVEVEVMNPDEAIELLIKGQKRRKVAYTALNSESSRSHSIFNIRLVQGPVDPQGEHVLLDKKKLAISQLSLVDLAGSERSVRTGSAGDRMKEAGNINQSLMALRNCIEILRENQKNGTSKMVPYRESKVTLLFKTFFEGKGKVNMIVCVNPKASDYDETLNVMKFAELTQEVQIAKAQVVKPDTGLTPGRRQANLQIKEALKLNPDADLGHISNSLVYSLGPPFPLFTQEDLQGEKYMIGLLKFLRDRQTIRNTLVNDLSNKEDSFRTRLIDMDREVANLRQQITNLQQVVKAKDEEMSFINKKFGEQERLNESLNIRVAAYEQERGELEKEVGDKNWAIVQEKLKNNKMRIDYNVKLALNEQHYNQNMEQAKRKLKEETALKLQSKQKLDLLSTILNKNGTETPEVTRAGKLMGSTNRSGRMMFPSTLDLYQGQGSRADENVRPSRYPAITPYKKKPKSPPPLKPKPLTADKTRRRSKSTDALWSENKHDNNADFGF